MKLKDRIYQLSNPKDKQKMRSLSRRPKLLGSEKQVQELFNDRRGKKYISKEKIRDLENKPKHLILY